MKGDSNAQKKDEEREDPRLVGEMHPGLEQELEKRFTDEEAANDPDIYEGTYGGKSTENAYRHAKVRVLKTQRERVVGSRTQNVEVEYESPLASSARFRAEGAEKGVAHDIKEKTAAKKSVQNVEDAGRRLEGVSARMANAERAAVKAKQIAVKAKQAKSLVGWGIVGFVATAYVWQLMCALITLIAWGMFAMVEEGKTTAWYGFFTNWISTLINSIFKPDVVGWAFWGIAALITVGVFLVCIVSFYITGVEVFKKHALLTYFLLAINFLPITNILPGLLIWVVVIKLGSTVALIHENPAS